MMETPFVNFFMSVKELFMVARQFFTVMVLLHIGLERLPAQERTNLQPTGMAEQILAQASWRMKTAEGGNFRFHYEEGSLAEQHLDGLQSQAEDARTKALVLLRETKFSPILDIFYIRSRDRMQEIIGMKAKGFTDYRSRTILLVYNDSTRAYHNHEVMHAVALGLWGFPADSNHCFIEGMAVHADDPCLGYPVHQIAAYLLHERQLIPFDVLFNNFRKQKDMPSYMEAGSVMQFLLETYGHRKVKELWQKGMKEIRSILGRGLDDVEKAYHDFLIRQYSAKPEVNWLFLEINGCG